jgi:hypothetical protein
MIIVIITQTFTFGHSENLLARIFSLSTTLARCTFVFNERRIIEYYIREEWADAKTINGFIDRLCRDTTHEFVHALGNCHVEWVPKMMDRWMKKRIIYAHSVGQRKDL